MPKTKMPTKPESSSSSSSSSDSGPDDRLPAKKAKVPRSKPPPKQNNDQSWEIGSNRFVKLSEFKGKWYVDIREFYNADGEMKPGRKGIMITLEQWERLRSCVPDIEEAIHNRI